MLTGKCKRFHINFLCYPKMFSKLLRKFYVLPKVSKVSKVNIL